MKKRFTLMMMVLCILMSIPLKMMAESVTIHYIFSEEKWSEIWAYVYQNGGGDIGPGWHGTKCENIKTNADGKREATWTLNLGDNLASNACVVFNDGKDNGEQFPAQGDKWFIEDGASYNKDGKITSSGGDSGTPGGGSTGPTEKWDTEIVNRLKGRVYSQGFYLAGNFFSFQPKENVDHGDLITYDDAVFKFQQQTDQDISSAKSARTVYEVYKVEIPASLTAHAQVMYVDEFGKIKNIFGPSSAYGISKNSPETDKYIGWYDAKVNDCDPITQENNNYWLFASRNETENEYSDGMYNLYIAVEPTTHTVKKWKIEHDSDKRVAYFISDAADATAMPIYDAYDKDVKYFSNRFYGSVNFAEDRSYFVISNLVLNREDAIVNRTKGKYGTVVSASGDTNPKSKYIPTTKKLFLMGNGGLDFANTDPNNTVCPNEKPIKFGADWSGNQIVEYNPTKGKREIANTDNHLGFAGEVQFQGGKRVKITSVSMVGDAIPGTSKLDATGKEVWDYTSPAANMTYDDVEQCYTTTIVTTADEGKKHFRFVGNHKKNINWHEDTDGTVPDKMAKTPLINQDAKGHTADVNDPNQVNYTEQDENSDDKYHIIWNRPAGRWTVRLYFYTYNVAGEPVTDYYYTISPCKDLELRDCVNIVYKSEDNVRVIQNVGEYKFLRTWSDEKAWKVSKDIDIYVVDQLSADKKNNAVTLHLNLLDSKDKSVKYNVIPANIGVILGTKKEAAGIEGGAVFHKRTSLTSLNTVVVPMYEYNASEDEAAEPAVTSLLKKLIQAQVVPTSETDATGKVTYNYLFGAGKGKSVGIDCENENDFFMGFWISNGKGNFYSNSCCLSIDKETADILGVGTRNDQFDPVTHAKKVPGVIFDFANVGGTTGINEVVNQSTKLNDGKYYTLSGQQVEKPTAGGIYIHNGRKFVVK